MNGRTSRVLFAAIATCLLGLAFLAGGAGAQELKSGVWTGTVEPPEGGAFDVEFLVEGGDEPAITLTFEGESLVFNEVFLSDGVLHFTWDDGVAISCELTLGDEGSFAGECVGDDGGVGRLTMTPPVDP